MLFGLGFSIGGLLGVGGSFIARHILNSLDYPHSFGICFLLSFIFQAISWGFLMLNREPAKPPDRVESSARDYFRRLPSLLHKNTNFSWYLVAMYLVIFGQMGVSFYILYARDLFQISDGFAGNLTLVAMLSQSAGTPILGYLGDRFGHKWLSLLSSVLTICSLVLLLLIPGLAWIYVVFLLMNLSFAGFKISNNAISMEFGNVDELPTYVALAGTLLGIPTFLAPLIGGAILDAGGFKILFGVAIAASLAGLVILRLRVTDPRKHAPADN